MSRQAETSTQRLFYLRVCASTNDIDQVTQEAKDFFASVAYNASPVGITVSRVQLVLDESKAETSEDDDNTTWSGGVVVDLEIDDSRPAFSDQLNNWLNDITSWDQSLNLYLGEGRDQIIWLSVKAI